LTGGLGNQLFQVAAALNLADPDTIEMEWNLGLPRLNTQNLPDITDFELPKNIYLGENRRPTNYQRKMFSLARRISISAKRYTKIPGLGLIQKIAAISISRLLKYPINFDAARGVGYSRISIDKSKTNFITGYYQSYKWVQDSKIVPIMKSLTIKKPSKKLEELIERSKIIKPLVVHIRLGDYKNEQTFGIPSKEYYQQALEMLWKSGEYDEIWVFSNEQHLANEYLPITLVNEYKWIDEIENSAAQTLEAMRCGKGYVIGNSTYSWWGAYLSHFDNPKIIAPSPWFKHQESPKDLIPPTWATLKAWPI
jgi:hypothetical protein